MIDDVLYVTTPYNRVVALNAETGAEIWAYDPKKHPWHTHARDLSPRRAPLVSLWTTMRIGESCRHAVFS